MCLCVYGCVYVCVEINLKASPSLITPLPVAERAGAGLSEGNVEGVRDRSRDVRLLCERLSLRKKKKKTEQGRGKKCAWVLTCV